MTAEPATLDAVPESRPESRPARLITDGLEPKNWIIVVTLLMGWHAERWAGVAWGVEAALFCGVIPILLIKAGERRATGATGTSAAARTGWSSSR